MKINVDMVSLGRDCKCPICGKEFLSTDEWIYKRKNKRLCSYSCMNEYDRRETAKPSARQLRNDSICDDFKSGVAISELAIRHGLKVSTIEKVISNRLFDGSVRGLRERDKLLATKQI